MSGNNAVMDAPIRCRVELQTVAGLAAGAAGLLEGSRRCRGGSGID